MLQTIKTTLKNTKGAFDLMSIMVGVFVVGVLAAVAVGAFTFIIPWSQDETTKTQLANVAQAQEVFRTTSAAGFTGPVNEYLLPRGGVYGTSQQLADSGILNIDNEKYCTTVGANGLTYQAFALSGSGKVFSITNANPNPVEVLLEDAPCLTGAPNNGSGNDDDDDNTPPVDNGDFAANYGTQTSYWFMVLDAMDAYSYTDYETDEFENTVTDEFGNPVEITVNVPAQPAQIIEVYEFLGDYDQTSDFINFWVGVDNGHQVFLSPTVWDGQMQTVYYSSSLNRPAGISTDIYNAWVSNGSPVYDATADYFG